MQTWWYENGHLELKGNWIDGIQDGLHREWYENGQLTIETFYDYGEIIEEECWDEDGYSIDCSSL